MPESKTRHKRKHSTPPNANKALTPNPMWYKVVMFSLLVIGLLWIITYYITSATPGAPQLPIPSIGAWNIAVGFGIMIAGFIMTTGWRG